MTVTRPVIIFDTDIGNDIDDALALVMLHSYVDMGFIDFAAVTISKDNKWAAVYTDIVNRFYGHPDIPIGIVRDGKTEDTGPFIKTVSEKMGKDFSSLTDIEDAVTLQRKILSESTDQSVVFVIVGFSTNIARLLRSQPDDISPLTGMELVRKKVRFMSMMAGNFSDHPEREYNIFIHPEAAQYVFANCPAPIICSGFEVGISIEYPAKSIENDFNYVNYHPVAEAYKVFMKMPYDRPSWDLTSVLYAVEPDASWFTLSSPGKIRVDANELTIYQKDENGKHFYLKADDIQRENVKNKLIELVTRLPRKF